MPKTGCYVSANLLFENLNKKFNKNDKVEIKENEE